MKIVSHGRSLSMDITSSSCKVAQWAVRKHNALGYRFFIFFCKFESHIKFFFCLGKTSDSVIVREICYQC